MSEAVGKQMEEWSGGESIQQPWSAGSRRRYCFDRVVVSVELKEGEGGLKV
jgi:hypothetical protein